MRMTSDQSKRAAGTYTPARKRTPLNVPTGKPTAPAWLSEGAKAVWNDLIKDLAKTGIMARVDWVTFAPLCELMAEFSEDPRGFSVGKLKELRLLAGELGCSIHSRLKMKSPEGVDPADDEPQEPKEPQCPQDAKVVSISSLLSGTRKASLPETSQPADMSASPASDS